MNSLTDLVSPYVFSGHTGLWIITNENERTQEELQNWAHSISANCLRWDIGLGMIDTDGKDHQGSTDPNYPLNIQMLMKEKANSDDRSLVILHNFHRYLESPKVMQLLANALHLAKQEKITFFILSPLVKIPIELERAFTILDHPLPVKEDMVNIFNGFDDEEEPEKGVYSAAKGLTHLEIENAFALSLRKHGKILEKEVWTAKVQTIKRKGFLEIWEGTETFDNLGGLHGLKDFTKRLLRPENPIPPRGILLVGVPGTGKSGFIKALGNEVHRPVLQMDVGRLHAKYVGESEANIREALKIADSMAPCILFIDEVEKSLSGVGGEGDSGVSTRVFGTLLTWLNDHETDVFVACSANDVSKLPPEFSRAERFDRQFMLDLPTKSERDQIWKIYRDKYKISPNSIPPSEDVDWTGAEIKACCRLAKSLDCSLFEAAKGLVPVAISMGERIQWLREWANGRVTSANSGDIYSTLEPIDLSEKKRKVTK